MKIVKTRKKYKVIVQEEISYTFKTREEAEKMLIAWQKYVTIETRPYEI